MTRTLFSSLVNYKAYQALEITVIHVLNLVEFHQITLGTHVILVWKNHYCKKKEKWLYVKTLASAVK